MIKLAFPPQTKDLVEQLKSIREDIDAIDHHVVEQVLEDLDAVIVELKRVRPRPSPV